VNKSPLARAQANKHLEITNFLLERGAIENAKEQAQQNNILLFKAIDAHNYEQVENILKEDVPLPWQCYHPVSSLQPLKVAARKGYDSIVDLILTSKGLYKRGFKIKDYNKALQEAQKNNHFICAHMIEVRLKRSQSKEAAKKKPYNFNVPEMVRTSAHYPMVLPQDRTASSSHNSTSSLGLMKGKSPSFQQP
jgi:hypothetical protein